MNINDALELLLFVLAIIAVFGCITLVILCSEKKSESRTDQSRGHRSNFTHVDEIDFSQYMNPPEENASTDEEDDTAEFNKHMDELVRQDAMIRCAWGIGTEDDWQVYNEECAKEAAKIEGGKTDV